jgi:hypothetical protein
MNADVRTGASGRMGQPEKKVDLVLGPTMRVVLGGKVDVACVIPMGMADKVQHFQPREQTVRDAGMD